MDKFHSVFAVIVFMVAYLFRFVKGFLKVCETCTKIRDIFKKRLK